VRIPALAPAGSARKCNGDPLSPDENQEAFVSRIPAMFMVGLAWVASACGTDSDTGSVDVTTVTAGEDVDLDGYVVELIGTGTVSIESNGSGRFAEVPEGDHEVRLTSVRGNCRVQRAHPRLIRVVAGETFQLSFEVACARAPLLGRMVVGRAQGDSSQIYVMNPDGSSGQRLTSSEVWELRPSISPDGTKILFYAYVRHESDSRENGVVYVMDADGSDLVAMTDGASDDADPAWSPDGSQIAFVRQVMYEFPNFDILVLGTDGSGPVNITGTEDVAEIDPVWSPDGRRILFLGISGDEPGNFYVMNPDGSGRTQITDDAIAKLGATWSPDGSRIAFFGTDQDEDYDLYVMDSDGSDRALVTTLPGFAWSPSWSSNGARIAFAHSPPGTGPFDLYSINPDGTGLTNISNTPDVGESIGAHPWGP
jgi:Tol biopolymer transport system component